MCCKFTNMTTTKNIYWVYGKSEIQVCRFVTNVLNRWHHNYEKNRIKLGISFDQPVFAIFPGVKNRAKLIETTLETLPEGALLFIIGIETDLENEFIQALYGEHVIYYNPKEVEYISVRTGLEPKVSKKEAKEREERWMTYLDEHFEEVEQIF